MYKGISNLVALLFVITIVIAASIFTLWVVMGLMRGFTTTASMAITGGTAFIDPSDSYVVYGEVLATISGGRVTITKVEAEYAGTSYTVTCLTCNTMINSGYPNSGNDFVYIRFFFTSNTVPRTGDVIKVTITYTANGETKYTSGYITII